MPSAVVVDTLIRGGGLSALEARLVADAFSSITYEALTFAVDYNAAGAVDPPADLIFTRQSEIDSFLAEAGASAFKHLMAVWHAIPRNPFHPVTVNLAAGVHRPRPTETSPAWGLVGKTYHAPGRITIQGPGVSSYPVHGALSALAITGSQTGSGDPWVDVSGTPFTGLSLKGRYALFNTGQVAVIHDHTNNRLRVLSQLSPTPTSVTVTDRPAAILRNSLDDVAGLFSGVVVQDENVTLQDVCVDPFGFSIGGAIAVSNSFQFASAFQVGTAGPSLTRVMIDQRKFWELTAANPAGQNCYVFTGTRMLVSVTDCTTLFPPKANDNIGFVLSANNCNVVSINRAYFGGSKFGTGVGGQSTQTQLIFTSVVCDLLGDAITGSTNNAGIFRMQSGANITFGGNPGKRCEMRAFQRPAAHTTMGSLSFEFGSGSYSTQNTLGEVLFTGNGANCVLLTENARVRNLNFLDGGSNVGYGIDVRGPFANCDLPAGTTVTGTLGNVLWKGLAETYANIVATGPLVDITDKLNRLDKA